MLEKKHEGGFEVSNTLWFYKKFFNFLICGKKLFKGIPHVKGSPIEFLSLKLLSHVTYLQKIALVIKLVMFSIDSYNIFMFQDNSLTNFSYEVVLTKNNVCTQTKSKHTKTKRFLCSVIYCLCKIFIYSIFRGVPITYSYQHFAFH